MKILVGLNENGTTIVMVTHDTDLARRTQRTVELQDGEIVESGDHDTLVASEGLYAELLSHIDPDEEVL